LRFKHESYARQTCLALRFSAVVLRCGRPRCDPSSEGYEVQSGNTIVVSNTNRPLKIRLKGIAPRSRPTFQRCGTRTFEGAGDGQGRCWSITRTCPMAISRRKSR
jgi:hypothetical protein